MWEEDYLLTLKNSLRGVFLCASGLRTKSHICSIIGAHMKEGETEGERVSVCVTF